MHLYVLLLATNYTVDVGKGFQFENCVHPDLMCDLDVHVIVLSSYVFIVKYEPGDQFKNSSLMLRPGTVEYIFYFSLAGNFFFFLTKLPYF